MADVDAEPIAELDLAEIWQRVREFEIPVYV